MAEDKNYEDLAPESPIGLVRALIPDMEKLSDPAYPDKAPSYLFGDSTLTRYLYMSKATITKVGDDVNVAATSPQVYRAAAHACDALGRSEMLILKKITTEDLATDGSVLANQYRQMAKALRDQADEMEAGDNDDGSGIFVVPFARRPVQFDPDATARGALWWV